MVAVKSLALQTFKFWKESWIPSFSIALMLSGLFTIQIRHLIGLQEWLDHTDQAISKGLLLQKLVLDAETGVRGYLLTGDHESLAPYISQSRIFDSNLDEAKIFVGDSGEQNLHLEALSLAFGSWRERADQLLKGENLTITEKFYFGNGGGRDLIDRCRHEIDDFLFREQNLRTSRSATLRKTIPRTIASGAALTLFLRPALSASIRALEAARRRKRIN